MAKLKITLLRSRYGRKAKQAGTLKALGLRKINQTVVHDENPIILGMINKVSHLVKVEPAEGEA